ncbi:MAG: hypothetical protein FWB74_05010, partial [Defluviitaleaceae bacterium]|nr:hypothetical protein [Defluviitaleaceae bacterium]
MKKSMKFLALVVLVIGAMGLAACSRPAPPLEVPAGDFSASAMGFNDYIFVTVNLSADGERIESIDFNYNREDPPWVAMMHPMVVNHIVDNQTTSGINVRNGATVTTEALILAVNTVLERVGFEVCGCATCNCAIVIEQPAPPVAGAAGEVVYPGPYSASALGWADPTDNSARTTRGTENIYVQVNFNADHSVIESIYVNFNMETQMFVNMMHPSVVDQIIAEQSTLGVNVVNGATVTTEALLEAVTEVMDRVGFVQGAAPPPATEPETEPET